MRVIATAGHVDHGKSTLVRALTGIDPDRLQEEKDRGLTIDLGFAWTSLPGDTEVAFVDVPGHVKFLRNMLAGVGGVDACLFVVAAPEGWKPQSEEHLRILELLGHRHGIVALTKVGIVDDDLRELAELEIDDQVSGTFLDGAPIVGVDALTGEGMDELRHALAELAARTPPAADGGRPRLWVDRSFSATGPGPWSPAPWPAARSRSTTNSRSCPAVRPCGFGPSRHARTRCRPSVPATGSPSTSRGCHGTRSSAVTHWSGPANGGTPSRSTRRSTSCRASITRSRAEAPTTCTSARPNTELRCESSGRARSNPASGVRPGPSAEFGPPAAR